MTVRGLPYGRGFVDDQVGQDQEWARRVRENPGADQWYITNVSSGVQALDSGNVEEDKVIFFPIQPFERDLFVSKCQINVGNAGTGASAEAGIYLYERDTNRLLLVQGTKVKFNLSSTGLVSEELSGLNFLLAKERYFIGTYVTSSVSPNLRRFETTVLPALTTSALSALPAEIDAEVLSKEADIDLLSVLYFSQSAPEALK